MVGTGVREATVGDQSITGLTPKVICAISAEIAQIWEQQRTYRAPARPMNPTSIHRVMKCC
jgi:hypothetical protein